MSLFEAKLFAYDLVRFVMNEHNLRWVLMESLDYNRAVVPTTFVPSIGQVVYEFSFKKSLFKRKTLHNLPKNQSQGFADLVSRESTFYFTKGFSMKSFLKFCSYVTALCVKYYKSGVTEVAEQACILVAETLIENNAGFVAEGSWAALYKETAEELKSKFYAKYYLTSHCC